MVALTVHYVQDPKAVGRLLGLQDGVGLEIQPAADQTDSDWLTATSRFPICTGIFDYSRITVHGGKSLTFTIGWSTRGSWVGVFTYGVQ